MWHHILTFQLLKAETAMFFGNAGTNHAVMWRKVPEE
jgi:hypothetical protein